MQINKDYQIHPSLEEEKVPHLKDYWKVVLARKWILISAFLITVICTTVYVLVQEPIYRATCRLEIHPSTVDPNEFKASWNPTDPRYGGQFLQQAILESEYKNILSNRVIENVFIKLELYDRPEFKNCSEPEQILKNLFNVSPLPEPSLLVDIHFDWKDADTAEQILRCLMEEYQSDFEQRIQGVDKENLDDAQEMRIKLLEEMEKKNKEKLNFEVEHNFFSLDQAKLKTSPKYDALRKNYEAALDDLAKAECRFKNVDNIGNPDDEMESSLDQMPEILENKTIQDLELDKIRAQNELSNLIEKFGTNHQLVKSAKTKLGQIETGIKLQIKSIYMGAVAKLHRARAVKDRIERELGAEEEKLSENRTLLNEYEKLSNDYKHTQQLYNKNEDTIKELQTVLSGKGRKKNIQVINPSRASNRPVKPKKTFTVLLASVLGMMLGIGLCFFVEYLDTTIKTKDDVENILETPILGYVPPIKDAAVSTNGKGPIELSGLEKSHSLLAEAFRSIRTSLMFSKIGKGMKNILVTSPMPSEGKTLVSLNIAITLAHAGKRILLVDTDLRKPRLHKILDVSYERGLSNFMAAEEGEESIEGIIADTGIENLSFIPSGPHPPNPAEILGSSRMKEFIDDVSKMFDHVIFDTPPTVNASDSSILAQNVDGVVLVVRSFSTERDIALRARDLLRGAQVKILGTVLNNVDVPRSGYYGYGSYYYYYYHPYYSYYSDDKTKTVRKRKRRRSSKKRRSHKEKTPVAS